MKIKLFRLNGQGAIPFWKSRGEFRGPGLLFLCLPISCLLLNPSWPVTNILPTGSKFLTTRTKANEYKPKLWKTISNFNGWRKMNKYSLCNFNCAQFIGFIFLRKYNYMLNVRLVTMTKALCLKQRSFQFLIWKMICS